MKKTILSILLSIGLLTSGVASAMGEAVEFKNDENGKLLITGSAEAGEAVTVRIFKKENHLDENGNFSYAKAQSALADAKHIKSVLCYADQTKAGDDGVFSFNAGISAPLDENGNETGDAVSNIYVVVAASQSGECETEILFIDPLERAEDCKKLYGMKESSEDDVKKFLDAHKYALGIYIPSLSSLDNDKVYSFLYDYLDAKSFDVADLNDALLNEKKNINALNDMQKLIVIEALNQDKIDTIKAYEAELMLSDSNIYSWYSKKLVNDKFKSAVTERLSNKGIKNIAEFDSAFTEAVILQWIASSDGISECMGVIGQFKEDIGYGKDAVINESAVREAMGTNFDNYSALKSAIDSYEDDDDDSSSGGGSSNRGNGGGFGGVTVSGTTTVTPPQAINSYFNDISSAPWAIEAINYLSEKNVLAGKGNGIFAPNDNVTRAEFAKIIVTAFGLANKADIAFADVTNDSWYAEYVKIAVGSGIAKGTSETTFGPEENITRQDMAVMLMNAACIAKGMQSEGGNVSFTDGAEISDYARNAVNTLTKAGIINGTGDGSFAPKAYATRAQAAKLVHGLLTY